MNTLKDRFFLLQQRRPDINLTQLARASGVATPSAHAWFTGKTKTMKHLTAVKAAALYGVDAHWLATGEGDMIKHAATNVTVLTTSERRGTSAPLFELQSIIDELTPLMRTAARSVLHDWIDGKANQADVSDAIEQFRAASAASQSTTVKKTAA